MDFLRFYMKRQQVCERQYGQLRSHVPLNLRPHTANAMSDQYTIRQNIEHAIFERFEFIQIRSFTLLQSRYEQSSPNQTRKNYEFRRHKASGRRTSSGFTALRVIVIARNYDVRNE